MSELARRRLRSVDALRGAAALAVVSYHLAASQTLTPSAGSWLAVATVPVHYGYTGVGLFLVVSGFCIHLSNARALKESDRPSFGSFWARRIYRLYPPYLAAMFFSILAGVLGAISFRGGFHVVWPLPPYASGSELMFDVGTHLLMLHTLFPQTLEGLFNPPLWSLALEEQLYMLYWLWLKVRRQRGALISIGVVLLVSLCWNNMGESLLWRRLGPARWFEWCLGALAVEAYCGRIVLPRWCYDLRIALICLGVALTPPLGAIGDMSFGCAFFILLNHAVQSEVVGRDFSRGLLGILSRVGVWSYSLYLMHIPLFKVAFGILARLHLEKEWWAQLTSMPAFALLGSYLFFLVIEKRFLAPPGYPRRGLPKEPELHPVDA